MLRSVYLKTLRDRWLGAVIAVAALFAIAWMGMWAYAGMGDEAIDFINQMPDAYLSLLGITADSGVAGMMLSNMFNFLGPFVIAGIGISMAASAIAGEESSGTMNILGAVPRSRTRLLTSTTLAALTVTVVAGATASATYLAAAGLAGTSMGSLNLFAATVHMLVVCGLFAGIALCVGAATGNRALASGVAVVIVLVSFLGSGIMPLFEGLADWAKIFPWYWISGPQPLANGVDWWPLVALTGVTAALVVVGWWGLNRRDLGAGGARSSVLAKLREDPRLSKALALLAGRGSTRGVAAKALTDVRPVLLVAAAVVFMQGVVLGPMFSAISGEIGDVVSSMPDAILAMVGFADFSTPEGWYFGEVLAITAPVAIAVVAINAGAALAGEEKRRTVGVLLSTPLSRSAMAWRKAVAILTGSAVIGLVVFAAISAGNAIAGLGINYLHIGAAALLLVGLGVLLGAVAFFAGAATGKSSVAVGAGTGVAILGWGINSFVPINPDLADWAKVSPFYYYGNPNPLEVGMTWWHLAVLVGVAAVLVVAGVVAYRQRDLRG